MHRTATASYKAAVDPLTWGSALGSGLLYATYDDDITKHFMDNNLIKSDHNADETLRTINGATLYFSALFVDKDSQDKRIARVTTNFMGSATSRIATNSLNASIKKKDSKWQCLLCHRISSCS